MVALPTEAGPFRYRKTKARELTRPTRAHAHAADNWICICGYNHVAFNANMRVVVFDFVDLSWRGGLCAEKLRRGSTIDKNDRRPTRERARRGRAGAMRVVAAVRAFGLCGT